VEGGAPNRCTDFASVSAQYAGSGVDAREFIHDMAAEYQAATSSSAAPAPRRWRNWRWSENPAILIPLPTATDDHQSKNAQAFVDAGAGVLLPQAELTPERLSAEVERILASPAAMAEKARALGDSASGRIAVRPVLVVGAHMKRLFRGRQPKLHFIGIGGIGMSGIAEILLGYGYAVSGSDLGTSEVTERLTKLGAQVYPRPQKRPTSAAPKFVVISTAIQPGQPRAANRRKRKSADRASRRDAGRAHASEHGHRHRRQSRQDHDDVARRDLLQVAKLDPTAVVGGVVKNFGSNAKPGWATIWSPKQTRATARFLHLFPTWRSSPTSIPKHLEH